MWIEYPALREAQYFLNSSTGKRFPLPPPLRLSAVQKQGSDSNTAPGSKVIARPRSLPRPLSTIHFSQGGPRSSNHESRFSIHGRSSLSPTRRGRNAPVRARPPQFESRLTTHDSRQFQPIANAPRTQRPRASAAPAVRITTHDSRFTIHDSRLTIHGSSSLSPTRRGLDAPVRARPPQFESRISIHDSRQFRAHPPGPSITAQAVLFCLETPASASRKRAVRPAHTGHNQTSRLPSQRDAYRHTGLSHEPATAPGRSRFRARDREMCKETLTLPMPGRQESSSTSFLRTVPARVPLVLGAKTVA